MFIRLNSENNTVIEMLNIVGGRLQKRLPLLSRNSFLTFQVRNVDILFY